MKKSIEIDVSTDTLVVVIYGVVDFQDLLLQ